MRATCTRDALLRALAPVVRCAGVNRTLPALEHVRVAVEGETLSLTCTDLERFATATIATPGASEGARIVPADLLHKLVRSLPPGVPVEIEEGAHGYLFVRATWTRDGGDRWSPGTRSRYEARLIGLDAGVFPRVPVLDGLTWATVPAAPLHALLVGALPFVSTDETRPNLGNVEVSADGAHVRAVASDEHRLHRGERALDGWTLADPIRVPRESAREIVERLNGAESVEIATAPGYLHLRGADGAILSVKLSDVGMGPVEHVRVDMGAMRSTVHVEASALRDDLKQIKRTAPTIRRGTLGVTCGWAGSTLRIAWRGDAGEMHRDLPARVTGASGFVGLNVAYLLDAIGGKVRGELAIGVQGTLDPVGIRLPGAAEPVILMPMCDDLGADAIPAPMLSAPEAPVETPDPVTARVSEDVAQVFGLAGAPETVVEPAPEIPPPVEAAPVVDLAPVVVEPAPVETPDPLDVLRAEAPDVEPAPAETPVVEPAREPAGEAPDVILGAPLDDSTGIYYPILYRDLSDTGLFVHGRTVYRAGAGEGGCALPLGTGATRADALRLAREHLAEVIPISRAIGRHSDCEVEAPIGETWTPCEPPAVKLRRASHTLTRGPSRITYYTDADARLDWACVRRHGQASWYRVTIHASDGATRRNRNAG